MKQDTSSRLEIEALTFLRRHCPRFLKPEITGGEVSDLSRLISLHVEEESLPLRSLAEEMEKQRDHAEALLLSLLAESQQYLMNKKCRAYTEARKHMCEVATLDKWERRLA